MKLVDSYDALAASIERSLRSDLGPADSATRLPQSIEHRLHEEARTGELGLAWIRTGVASISVGLSLWSLLFPRAANSAQAAGGLAFRAGSLVLAVVLLMALRRGWYRLWLRRIVPLADAAMILGGFVLLWGVPRGGVSAVPPAAVGYVCLLCGYLAVSGAMRLSHSAAQLSAALGVAVFVLAAAAARLPLVPSIAIACTLALLGVLGTSATKLVQRVVTHEAGRVELSQRYATAREAIDAREEVLKIVSHDLRNPLATIAMSADLMLEIDMPPEKRAKQLAIIKRAGERMNRLIQDLLDVAKLEAGRMSVVRRPLDVSALMTEADDLLAPLASEKSITFEARADDGLPELSADAGRAQQAIGNLVGNAIKFTPRGGRIRVRAERSGEGIRFSVADTGSGIPPEQLSQIFGRFWQADRADRRGIGLGLAITKAIVEAHGGRIWVESRVNEGTTFYFTLDSASPSGDGLPAMKAAERRASMA
jgi:signal transduction histidine kinase